MPPVPTRSVAQAQVELRTLAGKWRDSKLGETQAFQTWFHDFCDALGVPSPGPEGSDEYSFEFSRKYLRPDGSEASGRIDCWKSGHVAVEAKASGTGLNEALLRRAYNQLHGYVNAEHGTIPPYLMVVDVPHELIIWDGWTGRFGGFARGERIRLEQLPDKPELVALLQDIFTNPAARDPRGIALRVTKDIAARLAELAARLEGSNPERERGVSQGTSGGHSPEQVARFLMRCVFCFFAEDVGLLPNGLFKRTLESARTAGGPTRVADVLTRLWRTMDTGGDFGAEMIDRFNGHFFQSVESLPLEPADVQLLVEAAGFDWSNVEPSIFGTLLVRALDPVERHKLGAEYTPREYIERLVEPTVLEPLRAKWAAVQARVTQLEEDDATAHAQALEGAS
ncbi:MAG: type IIL restriction-modification enzyme MmeI [Gemmatimonadota bacterium]